MSKWRKVKSTKSWARINSPKPTIDKSELVKKLKEIAERKKNGVSVPVRGL